MTSYPRVFYTRMRAILFSLAIAIAMLSPAILSGKTQAIEFSDGTTAFITPPQFVEASNTNATTRQRNATFFFTIDIPDTADAPLQRVEIVPQNFVRQLRPFRLEETRAFEGTRANQGDELPLGEVSEDPDSRTVTLVFDPPVEPGRLVTITLRPQHNPRASGIYLFRLITFPAGERPRSHVAGLARIHIYDRGGSGIFFR